MRIALVHNAKLPVFGYGGTERVVTWLAKGLSEAGIDVILAAAPGSQNPYGEVAFPDFSKPVETQIPSADLFHHFVTPPYEPEVPYLVTIGGNGQMGETFLPNTAFVSRNHAQRHGADAFVYNGVDPDEYLFRVDKQDYLVFLAKAAWRVKNVSGAIRMARAKKRPLKILGGTNWNPFRRGVQWKGMVGGKEKAELVSGARALLFPVIWNEPFGIAVVEALVSGTPVIASRRGSLPELLTRDVGFLCEKESEFIDAIDRLPEISPDRCREWALDKFHYRKMTDAYLKLYEEILKGQPINSRVPQATEPPQQLLPLL